MWSLENNHILIDWHTLAAIAVLATLDLVMRYLAFKRFESVAIDIALFSFAYSLVEFGRHFGAGESLLSQYPVRAIVNTLSLLLLVVVHVQLRSRLSDSLDQTFASVLQTKHPESPPSGTRADSESVAHHQIMHAAEPVLKRSVLLTFSGPEVPKFVRDGKRNWRGEAATLLNQLSTANGVELKETDLLLSRFWRFYGAFIFLVLSIVSIFTPAVAFHYN